MHRRETHSINLASEKSVSVQSDGSGNESQGRCSSFDRTLVSDDGRGDIMFSPVYENFSATGDELDTAAEPIGSSSPTSSDSSNLQEAYAEKYYWRFGKKIIKQNQSKRLFRFNNENGDSSQFELTDDYRTDSFRPANQRKNLCWTHEARISANARCNGKYEESRSGFLSSSRRVDRYVSGTSDEYKSPVEQLSDFDRMTSCRESMCTDDGLSEIDEEKFIQGSFVPRRFRSDRAIEEIEVTQKTSTDITQASKDSNKQNKTAFSAIALPVKRLTDEVDEKPINWAKPFVQFSENKHESNPSEDVLSKASEARIANAWETLLVYVGCVQLCLGASENGNSKASEFLYKDCFLLRKSFGLDELLLHPKEVYSCKERHTDSPSLTQSRSIRKVKVQVQDVKMKLTMPLGCQFLPTNSICKKIEFREASHISKKSLKSVKLCRKAQLGAEGIDKLKSGYRYRLTENFQAGLKMFCRVTTMPQGVFSYVMRLQNSTKERAVFMQPGNDDTAVFFTTSCGDNLILEVYDDLENLQGCATICVDTITKDKINHASWWQILSEAGKQPIGRVKMHFSYAATSSTISAQKLKWRSIEKTFAYDILLDAAIKMHQFQPRNLHMHSSWKWLLSEFARCYGVSFAFANLRYVLCIMELATPTRDCLTLIHELLYPVIRASSVYALTGIEQQMLDEVKELAIQLLAIVFQSYKSLDEFSNTGVSDIFLPASANIAPALIPAVQLYTLLHDVFSPEGKQSLVYYFQMATEQRCLHLMEEVQELSSSGRQCTQVEPSVNTSAYVKMKTLCENIVEEIRADIDLKNRHVLPCSVDLPNITVKVYLGEFYKKLRALLAAFPPLTISPQISHLVIATLNFENSLLSWGFSSLKATFQIKEIFQCYIKFWIQNMCSQAFSRCSLEKVRWADSVTPEKTISYVEDLCDFINLSLDNFDVVVRVWPQYLDCLEIAAVDMEKAMIDALEKHHFNVLPSYKTVKLSTIFLLQLLTKMARHGLNSSYKVSNRLGVVMNTMKRLLDVRHPQLEKKFKFWLSLCDDFDHQKQHIVGDRLKENSRLLCTKYKSHVQAVSKNLADKAGKRHGVKLDRILHGVRHARGEREVGEIVQPLKSQLSQTISHMDNVFISSVLMDVSRGYFDHLCQDVLEFFKNWKDTRAACNGSGLVLAMLNDVFSSAVQIPKADETSLSAPDNEPKAQLMCFDDDSKAHETNSLLHH